MKLNQHKFSWKTIPIVFFPSLKIIDSVLKIGKKYYYWVFLEKCKCIIKENKKTNTLVMT